MKCLDWCFKTLSSLAGKKSSLSLSVLGKLTMPGRPTNSEKGRARAHSSALAVGAGGDCLGIFSSVYLFSFLSPSLRDGPLWTEILYQRAVNPKTTN